MAQKLFALENADLENQGTPELEASPEQGEVADVQVDVGDDMGEMEEVAAGVEEGVGAADQLEEVQDVVEQAAEQGEGLDPVAAEAVRLAVEAICARVGANPKAMYSLYAVENFRSSSSRKANTRVALEGIGEFLKSLWEKIKAALTGLWEKVTAFWNKHLSSLGRTLKALEAMKNKVSQVKGSPSYEPVTAPSGLATIFPSKATIGVDEIGQYATRVEACMKEVEQFRLLQSFANASKMSDISTAVATAKGNGITVKFGDEGNPVPGGVYYSWVFKIETEHDDGVDILTLDIDEDHGTNNDGRKDAQMDIANKDKLKNLIAAAVKSTKELVKYRDKIVQRNKAVANNFKAIDKEIANFTTNAQGPGAGSSGARAAKNDIRSFQLVMAKAPMIEAKLLSIQLTFLKGVLLFTSTCLSNYKKA